MTHDLAGKVAVITGASRGLGRTMAGALAEAGAAVVLGSRTVADLNAFSQELSDAGHRSLPVETDVTDPDSVDNLISSTVAHFGRVDVVVNNSGVVAFAPLIDQDVEEWDRVLSTNLRGTFLTMRAAGRHLVAQGSGKVINIASNFAYLGVPNCAAYAASKAAVISLTRTMAVEWARHNVQVNALAPGYFATDMNQALREDPANLQKVLRRIPAGRMGEAVELVPWLLLLASSASDFMTGEAIVLDGGQSVT